MIERLSIQMNSRFKELRQYLGLSQFAFAKKIDRSVGCIANIEMNNNGISDETIDAVCAVYGVNKEWLVNGVGPMFIPGFEKGKADILSIGPRVRKVRKDAGLSQKAFAETIGYTLMQINYVENGKTKPSHEFIRKVCAKFAVSANWLLSGEGEEKIKEPEKVDDKLIEWLNAHPDEITRLKIKMS